MINVLLYTLWVPVVYWAISAIYGLVFKTIPLIPKYIIRRDFSALIILFPLMVLWSLFLCWMVFPGVIAETINNKHY